jgi:hypothetical protein
MPFKFPNYLRSWSGMMLFSIYIMRNPLELFT